MIKIENVEIHGWEAALRGMRNPKNSWHLSDSFTTKIEDEETLQVADFAFFMGDNDHDLAMRLAKGGPVHGKYKRMITVYLDITAPLYWWKEFDTYKVGTVANSCSTMHKIHAKELTIDDFSHEHLINDEKFCWDNCIMAGSEWCETPYNVLETLIYALNEYREKFLETEDKRYWWQMIQLLPSSYNQKRTVMLNYEVLTNIYESRRHHKLDEWHVVCDWIEELPYSELIIGEKKEEK